MKSLKAIIRCIFIQPKFRSHGLVELAETMRMVIVLSTDEECVIVLRVLLFCFAWGFVPAAKDNMNGCPTVVEVLLFQCMRW